ncbi:hypothetical protein AFUB_088590 [Aspergillus fumigatus A1163]|uniref:V-type proton ATPase subunit G n=1 Tax=Aspergillus fumigatus (strain CBS 144.89 / FGSC A1163 / CEA10) TaxID=451804 RepID=B0YC18_ASPFC|nr:hypothetical protein AFUB_088590 [Aspergillus fumigatus A1163]
MLSSLRAYRFLLLLGPMHEVDDPRSTKTGLAIFKAASVIITNGSGERWQNPRPPCGSFVAYAIRGSSCPSPAPHLYLIYPELCLLHLVIVAVFRDTQPSWSCWGDCCWTWTNVPLLGRERGSEDCTASQRIQQKEEEFKKFEAEHSSGYKKAEEDANKEAEVKLQDIQTAGKEKGNKVVEDLINAVIDVNPQAVLNIPSVLLFAIDMKSSCFSPASLRLAGTIEKMDAFHIHCRSLCL